MKELFKNKIFWIIFAVSSLLCFIANLYISEYAFPRKIEEPPITRTKAIEQANKVAKKITIDANDYYKVAKFTRNEEVIAFIELEHGGINKLLKIRRKNLYQPFTWQIRYFKPVNLNKQDKPIYDTKIILSPEGKPYEFIKKVYDKKQKKLLKIDEAQKLAERIASKDWGINFANYKQLPILEPETEIDQKNNNYDPIKSIEMFNTSKNKPSISRDYVFFYERINAKLGENSYFLKLVITGKMLTELRHFIEIPESFNNKFNRIKMNNYMVVFLSIIGILLFFFGGCLGLFLLRRTGWIIWKPAIYWTIFLNILGLIFVLDRIPLSFMDYDIFTSGKFFITKIAIVILLSIAILTPVYILIISAAETFTRKEFGNQIQFWKTWSDNVASSYIVLKNTLVGYLIVPFILLYVALWYIWITKYLNWWILLDPFIEPNISVYAPFLSIITISLIAGFIEECFQSHPFSRSSINR